MKRKLKQRNQGRKLDQLMEDQFATGRVYAAISSRPGQVRSLQLRLLQRTRCAPGVPHALHWRFPGAGGARVRRESGGR